MKFRTELNPNSYPFQIAYDDHLMFIGSCFSDHIGTFFKNIKFPTLSNPFGVLFNPASIALALRIAINPEKFDEKYIHYFNDHWISFAHHGKFSHSDKNLFLKNISDKLDETHDFLLKADYLFVTFGTAYYYQHKQREIIVANCHKIQGYEFEKKRLEIEEITFDYNMLFQEIRNLNPQLRIIFTVSPVRHLGDGFHENQLSKSILHLAIDQLVDDTGIFYFPSYEIVHDDLRDYRFYAKDLCHPGEQAIEYVQEKVKSVFFSEETLEEIKSIEKSNKMERHIPLNGN